MEMILCEIGSIAIEDARTWLWAATVVYAIGFGVGGYFAKKGKMIPGMGFLGFVLLGFVLQTKGLYYRGMDTHACPLGNGMEQIQFIAWSFVLTYLLIRFIFQLHLLGLFTTGLAMILSLVSLACPALDVAYWSQPGYEKLFSNPWIELHAAVAVFSYGVFGLLAMVAVMYLLQHAALRKKQTSAFLRILPSIQQLEQSAEKLLLIGVVFLTVSVGVGAIHWLQDLGNVAVAKLWVTIFVWVLYLTMLILHRTGHLYAKRFAQAGVIAFALALISMGTVGSSASKKDKSDKNFREEAAPKHV
jgi:HemX protein